MVAPVRWTILFLLIGCTAYLFWKWDRDETRRRHREQAQRDHLKFLRWQMKERAKHQEDEARRQAILASLYRDIRSWEDVFEIAETYHRGSFPDFTSIKPLAAAVYHGIIAKCENQDITNLARQRLHECMIRSIEQHDERGDSLPEAAAHRVLDYLKTLPDPKPPASPHKHDRIPTPSDPPRHTPHKPNDRQNAHDHGVTSAIRTTLEALKTEALERETHPVDPHVLLQSVESTLLSDAIDMNDEERAKALTVLQSLSADHTHSGFGMSEQEVLEHVWLKIDAHSDQEIQKNARETLCKQLASGYERGSVVCSTGKIARITSALDGVPDVPHTLAKPMWAVQEELATLASKIRNDVLEGASDTDRQAYAIGTSKDLEDVMKATFRDTAFSTYCDDLGMSKTILEPMVMTISEGF